ncbi:hypothetical protein BDA99DRAFT_243161 [Phascolomyces articulosus]|uniref:Uncharacterized protein n=1 Tax=Phascolomyces articulosus TaxID=60185 RepID=A0AAD5KL37_9FUNG|nr:hypothetical protein BDA99DRAFT_243161 [Phascolomyces articulosus]
MGHHVGMLDGMDAVTGMFSNQAPAITSQDGYSNMLPAVTNPASELNNLDVSNPIPSSQQYQISLPEELHRNNSTATSFTSNDSDFLFSMDYLQNIVIDMQFQQHSQEGQIGQGHVMHRMADNIGLFGTQASVMTGQGGDGDMLSTTVDSTQSNATVTSNPILPTQQQQALAPGQPYGQQNHYNNSSTTSDNSFDSILPTNYAEYPAIMSGKYSSTYLFVHAHLILIDSTLLPLI